jgi:hypothetical protein
MKQLIVYVLFALFLATACNDTVKEKNEPAGGGSNMDGGGCTYKHDTAIAEVVKINTIDVNRYDILFVLSSNRSAPGRQDTLHYASEKRGLLSGEELKKLDVKPGDHYTYIVSTIISGSCNPQTTMLVMEKIK